MKKKNPKSCKNIKKIRISLKDPLPLKMKINCTVVVARYGQGVRGKRNDNFNGKLSCNYRHQAKVSDGPLFVYTVIAEAYDFC